MDIGPGDFVECAIPAGRNPEVMRHQVTLNGEWPENGRVYQVREVGLYRGGEPGLKLVGVIASLPGWPDCWWPAECFRPIYRPKADLIESLLTPIEEGVEA